MLITDLNGTATSQPPRTWSLCLHPLKGQNKGEHRWWTKATLGRVEHVEQELTLDWLPLFSSGCKHRWSREERVVRVRVEWLWPQLLLKIPFHNFEILDTSSQSLQNLQSLLQYCIKETERIGYDAVECHLHRWWLWGVNKYGMPGEVSYLRGRLECDWLAFWISTIVDETRCPRDSYAVLNFDLKAHRRIELSMMGTRAFSFLMRFDVENGLDQDMCNPLFIL